MVVGICDDDRIWHKKAEKIIEKYAVEAGMELHIVHFYGDSMADELMAYSETPLDVLFVDIELDSEKENGIVLAEKMNRKSESCSIVFVTNYLSYATEVYHTQHAYYVLKEQFEAKLGQVFGKILRQEAQKEKSLLFHCIGGVSISLAPADIYYFERVKRKTVIETVWGTYEIYDKISAVESKISDTNFVRCHNSYIVYLPNVLEYQKDVFHLKNGKDIIISRGYAKKVRTAVARWIMEQTV